jgi:hypothetical protein
MAQFLIVFHNVTTVMEQVIHIVMVAFDLPLKNFTK